MSFTNQFSLYFYKLKKEINGVEQAFIFPRNALELEDKFQRNLNHLVSALSERTVPKRIIIQTHKKSMEIHVTEHFLLGAVSNSDANPILIGIILSRITSHLEEYFETFQIEGITAFEEKIKDRIEDLIENDGNPVRTSMLALFSNDLDVEGEIELTVKPQVEQKVLKKKIQNIINEEIPFFCRKRIHIELKTEYLGLDHIGLTKQQLSRVIQRIQEM